MTKSPFQWLLENQCYTELPSGEKIIRSGVEELENYARYREKELTYKIFTELEERLNNEYSKVFSVLNEIKKGLD